MARPQRHPPLDGAFDRQRRMTALDAWLDELDVAHGAPSAEAGARAEAWFDSATSVQPR